jgi:hypothetical protein
VSRVLPILFLLMSLAVAAREIPELYNLADDPSNDGQIFNWQDQTEVCTAHHAENGEKVPPARTPTISHAENLNRTSEVAARTGQDILRLVGSLRT